MMGRRMLAAAAAMLVLGTFGTASVSAQTTGPTTGPTGAPEATEDGKITFVYGMSTEPSSLNPMRGYLAADFYFWAWSYHLPITFGDNLEAVPDLVTDVEVSEDGREFTYTLRDDVVWSDGEPLTAEDVKFTWDIYKSNHAYLPQNYLKLMESVEVVDDHTVVLRSTAPTSLYDGSVPYMYTYILPEHVWSGLEKPKQYDNVPSVGSGPFIIAEYEEGQFVRMERNPHWGGPEPHIDEMIFRVFKNDDAIAEALKAGEIDFAYIDTANVFNSLKDEPNIDTAVGPIPEFDEIAMNTGSAYQKAEGGFEPHGDGHPALTDPVVRRAVRMAINSEEVVERVHLGYALPGDSIIPPVSVAGARWEPSEEERIPWDIEGANQLLEDAGYVDSDGDGVREMPQGSLEPGRPLEFRYYTQTNDQNTVKAAPFVQSWLEDIGIATEVTSMNSGRLGDEINAGTYDLFHWGWIPDPDPDSALSWFQCDERPPDGQTYGNNDVYYCNPEYDRLYLEQRTTLDPERRMEIVHEMQRIFYEDAAYAVLWYPPTFQAFRTDTFTGYQPQPAPDGDLLSGYSRDVALSLRPVSEGSTVRETRGIPPALWIGIGAGILVLIGVVWGFRRRGGGGEDTA